MRTIDIIAGSKEAELAYSLYKQACEERDMLHTPLIAQDFEEKFLRQTEGMKKITLLLEGGMAFASGVADQLTGKLFVTMVVTEKSCRRQGFGRAVLYALEKRLLEQDGKMEQDGEIEHGFKIEHGDKIEDGFKKELEISFFNPITLPWRVPGGIRVEHPNTPGVDVCSDAYIFLKNCGYRDFAMQNSYYLDLSDYKLPADMEEKRLQLEKEGFTFIFYDQDIHTGMEKMLQDFQNPLWEKELLSEPAEDKGGRPILVPVYQGRVCGFAGPLDVEKSKRGYFAGIGVDETFRGRGLAKVLFCLMCDELKERGAEFMTLFTGENNPARNIYEAVGFSIIRSWADMRKKQF